MTDIDPAAMDSMAVVPGDGDDDAAPVHDPRQEAGQDKSIDRKSVV